MSAPAAEQLRRILHLVPALADDEEHDVAEVATRLGVDQATLLRDLRSLAERFDDPGGFVEGVSIYLDGTRVSVHASHFLRPMRLTVPELAALDLGLAMLRAERPPDERSVVDSARQRLEAALAAMPDSEPPSDVRTATLADLSPAQRALHAAIRRAVRDACKVSIQYRKADATHAIERVVCPYGMIFARGSWYLVAHCETSRGLRVFRLDRVEEAAPLADHFEMPADFAMEQVLHDGRVFHTEDPVRSVTIRYSPRIAGWIAERENVAVDSDGSLTCEYPLGDTDWAVRHVLQYGPDAEVLAPADVRAAVRNCLRAAAR